MLRCAALLQVFDNGTQAYQDAQNVWALAALQEPETFAAAGRAGYSRLLSISKEYGLSMTISAFRWALDPALCLQY